jgi:hypothetical protein
MSDWGGYRALMQEAREIAEEERKQPPQACPLDGTPLEFHPKKNVWFCPMGNYQTTGAGRGC